MKVPFAVTTAGAVATLAAARQFNEGEVSEAR
jgi:hypothetical protein